jgi:hypothetical protein
MQQAVLNGSMPFTADASLTPPARALTAEQRSTLLTWLAEGAHDEGGQLCAPSCTWR